MQCNVSHESHTEKTISKPLSLWASALIDWRSFAAWVSLMPLMGFSMVNVGHASRGYVFGNLEMEVRPWIQEFDNDLAHFTCKLKLIFDAWSGSG